MKHPYSYRNESTGLFNAVFIDCNPTVTNDTIKTRAADKRNISTPKDTLYA